MNRNEVNRLCGRLGRARDRARRTEAKAEARRRVKLALAHLEAEVDMSEKEKSKLSRVLEGIVVADILMKRSKAEGVKGSRTERTPRTDRTKTQARFLAALGMTGEGAGKN